MDALLQDLRLALRGLRRSPGFATAAILTLALGIGANTAIFSVVDALLLRPLPFRDADRLVSVWGSHASVGLEAVSLPDFVDWRAHVPAFESLSAFAGSAYPVKGDGEPELVPGAQVTADFFHTLGVTMAAGRDFRPDEDRKAAERVAIISYGYWQRHYGGRLDAVGHLISTGGESPYRIVGVAPRGFRLEHEADLWTPIALDEAHGRREDFLTVIGRLRSGATLDGARGETVTLMRRLEAQYPASNTGWSAQVVPLREWLVGDVRVALLVFMGAVGLVLLIACANVANLMLARLAFRQREITVRAALGASRSRLVRQVLTESVLLSLLGGACGVLLAVWGVQALRLSGGGAIPRSDEISLDLPVLAFACALSVITGLLFGAVPALRLIRQDLHESLKSGARSVVGGAGARRLRGSLVVAEVATAFVLLVGAGLLLRSFVQLLRVDPGFRSEDVLTARLSLPRLKYTEEPRRVALYNELLGRISVMPGVRSAAVTTAAPLGEGPPELAFTVDKAPPLPAGTVQDAEVIEASPGYFSTLRIPLIRGRALATSDDAGAPAVAVINREMARRYWKGADALGSRFTFDDVSDSAARWITVVGVVGDVRHLDLAERAMPQLYLPMAQSAERGAVLLVRLTRDPMAVAAAIRRSLAELDPDVPLSNVRTMPERVASSVARPRFSAGLLSAFALSALILAAIGIYGVIAYSVVQRTRELGIRVALGAGRGSLVRTVLTQAMLPVLLGTTIGLILAVAGSRLVASLLFGVSSLDPGTYAGVASFLLAVALAASYGPAHRAARLDPVTALRAD